MIYKKLACVPLCYVLPCSHPHAENETISRQAPLCENLISCNSYAISSKAAELQNRISVQLPPESTHIYENLQAALTLVRVGYGYSIFPEVPPGDGKLKYIPLKDTEPLPYGLFYRKGSSSPLLKQFISIDGECADS